MDPGGCWGNRFVADKIKIIKAKIIKLNKLVFLFMFLKTSSVFLISEKIISQ